MTCLWQVSGRNRISNFDEWVRLDLEYIDRWSLGLDMRILARTFWAVLPGRVPDGSLVHASGSPALFVFRVRPEP